jgi:hypothetical protein
MREVYHFDDYRAPKKSKKIAKQRAQLFAAIRAAAHSQTDSMPYHFTEELQRTVVHENDAMTETLKAQYRAGMLVLRFLVQGDDLPKLGESTNVLDLIDQPISARAQTWVIHENDGATWFMERDGDAAVPNTFMRLNDDYAARSVLIISDILARKYGLMKDKNRASARGNLRRITKPMRKLVKRLGKSARQMVSAVYQQPAPRNPEDDDLILD